MTRIAGLFHRLKRDGQKGLIAYITAGDPSPDRTPSLVDALVRGGADLIELGVPFSDPIADGPVIQRGGERALKAGTTLPKVLEIAAEIRRRSEVPLLLFTYLNPVMRYGLERLAKDAAGCGIDGCLLIDASVDEAHEYIGAMQAHGLDTVFLAAPTSTERRLKLVAQYSTGFVYLVSRTGVTGERDSISGTVAPLVRAMRAITSLPLAVGFGVSRPEHVAELGRQVEAVVVGSAFVRLIEKSLQTSAPAIQTSDTDNQTSAPAFQTSDTDNQTSGTDDRISSSVIPSHGGSGTDDRISSSVIPSLEIQLEAFTRELKQGFGAAA